MCGTDARYNEKEKRSAAIRRLSILMVGFLAVVPAGDARPHVSGKAPQALVGTWQRTVTRGEIRRVPGKSADVAPGPWRMHITAGGSIALSSPPGEPPIAVGTVKRVRAGVVSVRFVARGGGECTRAGTYAWRRSLRALRLVKLHDPCAGRDVILVGRWRKV